MTIAKRHDGNHTLTSVAMLGVSNVAAALIRARCIHTILVTSTIISSTFIVIYAYKHKTLPLLTSPPP